MTAYDAVVVGSGPNGLVAAVTLARAGRSVLVVEEAEQPGGGLRSAELTIPGCCHDICASVHAFAPVSSALRDLPLSEHGLHWRQPPIALAHPLDGGRAVVLRQNHAQTAEGFGADARTYRRLVRASDTEDLVEELLRPLLHRPRRLRPLAHFGRYGTRSLLGLAGLFSGAEPPALLGGLAAHAVLPLSAPFTGGFALLFAHSAHATGWPFAAGGSGQFAESLLSYAASLGVKVDAARRVDTLTDLPRARAYLLDVGPHEAARIAAGQLPERRLRRLRSFRYGPGVFKIDYALAGAVPWAAADCASAGTLHLGGTVAEIAAAEAEVAAGRHPQRPFVIVGQPGVADRTRSPAGTHTLWAYCHVPAGSTLDLTDAVEAQLERFAPGFRDLVLARRVSSPRDLQAHSRNLVGGDVSGGSHAGRQLLFRPGLALRPYRLSSHVYLCSASTPPGAGSHGMPGYLAARAAIASADRV